jgi:hypothetical protein
MLTYCWWQRFFAPYRAAAYRRLHCGASTYRVQFELLETRIVPATIYVTGNVTNGVIFTDPLRFTDGDAKPLVHLASGPYLAVNLRSAVEKAQALGGSNKILLETSQPYSLTQGELTIQYGPATALTIKPMSSGLTTINSNGSDRIFEVATGGTTLLDHLQLTGGVADVGGAILSHGQLTLTNDQLTGNKADGGGIGPAEGGAILNQGQLTLTNDQITGNMAIGANGEGDEPGMGGGIFNDASAALTMTNSTLDSNIAQGGTSDSINVDGAGGEGGGLWINSGSRPVTIIASTFSNNQAIAGGYTGTETGNAGSALGGGLAIDQAAITVKVTNSTFAGNSATGGSVGSSSSGYGGNAFGGGIGAQNQNSLRLVNDTIAQNRATAGTGYGGGSDGTANGGGINNVGGNSAVQLVNTLIAQNTANVSGAGSASNDVNGTFNSLGHNFVGNVDGASGFSSALHDQLGSASGSGLLNPQFDPSGLTNNGGPTKTLALVAYSPAINTGDNAVTSSSTLLASLGISPLSTDQRGSGFARKVDGTVDIGAYEFQMNLNKVYSFTSDRTQFVTFAVKAPGLLLGSAAFPLPFQGQFYTVELVGGSPAGTNLQVHTDGSFAITVPPRFSGTAQFQFHVLVSDGETTRSTNLVYTAIIFVKSSGFGRGSAGDYL